MQANETKLLEYIIEINPTVPGAITRGGSPGSDEQYRNVCGVLSQNGFPGGLSSSDDFDWIYKTERELDAETIKRLESIRGVKVTKYS